MGYACPVCEEPQADAEHLANHLAFSAMLGRAAHADWLDEHAPGWDEEGPEELAERVAPHAEEVDLPGVTEGDAELPDPPGPAGPGRVEDTLRRGAGPDRERLDPETRRVIEEARELTSRSRSAEQGSEGADAGEGAGEREVDDENADEPSGDENG